MRYRNYVAGRLSELEYKEIPALDEVEWGVFVLGELFTTIEPTNGKTTSGLVEGNDLPYIAASRENNGCAGVASALDNGDWMSKGNCIVFVQLGDGAVGWAHYVPMDFIGMNGKTSCGYIKDKMNVFVGLFIAQCLRINKEKFSHGHSWTGAHLTRTKLRLPVTANGEPDYAYMEQYAKNMMVRKYQQYLAYLDAGSDEE